jgi:hypothetical protein
LAETVSVCARKTLENVGVHAQMEGMADLGVGAKNFGLLQVGIIRPIRKATSGAYRLNRLAFRISAAGPELFLRMVSLLGNALYHGC